MVQRWVIWIRWRQMNELRCHVHPVQLISDCTFKNQQVAHARLWEAGISDKWFNRLLLIVFCGLADPPPPLLLHIQANVISVNADLSPMHQSANDHNNWCEPLKPLGAIAVHSGLCNEMLKGKWPTRHWRLFYKFHVGHKRLVTDDVKMGMAAGLLT